MARGTKRIKGTVQIPIELDFLEELFGGADEVVVQFRESVVQEFAKRHLKGIANTETMKAITEETRKATEEILKAEFLKPSTNYWSINQSLRETLKQKVREETNLQIERVIAETIGSRLTTLEADFKKRVQDFINKLDVESYIDKKVGEWISYKIRIALDEAFKNSKDVLDKALIEAFRKPLGKN